MNIKTAVEISKELFSELKFKCPKCNSFNLIDNTKYFFWKCNDCNVTFSNPIKILDEGIDPKSKWIEVRHVIGVLKPYADEYMNVQGVINELEERSKVVVDKYRCTYCREVFSGYPDAVKHFKLNKHEWGGIEHLERSGVKKNE